MSDTPESGFQCNICGTRNGAVPAAEDREVPSCSGCGSTIRTRSLMQALSEELFGRTIPVRDFPRLKGLRGVGMSDSADYAALLEQCFDYRNTWYHRDPRLDVTDPAETEWGQYDFILCSEVLEHVAPPVEKACGNLCRLLKPDGILLLTVPFVNTPEAREHFPSLHEWTVASLGTDLVLVNRTVDGRIEVREDLVFHGGPGSTLEMRLFSGRQLREALLDGGFSQVCFYPGPALEWGISHPGDWSLPLAARKRPFSLRRGATSDWAGQWSALLDRVRSLEAEAAQLRTESPWLSELSARTEWARRLDAELESASERLRSLEAELEARTGWARDLERQLAERTEWALSLQRESAEHERLAREFQSEAARVGVELQETRSRLSTLESSPLMRLARRLGLSSR